MSPWLVVTIDGREHFIARAQVVEVVFDQQPPMVSDRYGTRPAREDETPTQPATFRAVIATTMPPRDAWSGPAIQLFGDDAHVLHNQLQQEAASGS